jgi:hypothetical protein
MLYPDTRCKWAVSITLLPLHLQENTLDTHWTRGWVAPDPFWNSAKITLFPTWERTLDFSAHHLMIIPCMLSRLLTWLFVPKTAEVTRECIKLNSNEFQNSHFSLNFLGREFQDREWRMKNMCKRKSHKILIEKPGNTNLFERHNCDKIILNITSKRWDLKVAIEDAEFYSGSNLCKHQRNEVTYKSVSWVHWSTEWLSFPSLLPGK